MKSRIFSMLFLLFHVFCKRRDHQADFLAYQIQMLRKRLKKDHIIPSAEERKELLALGAKFGHEIDDYLEVVTPDTYKRWLRKEAAKAVPVNVGRKPTEGEAAEMVLKMKRENPSWGYTRILGELLKLGIKLARATVKRILQRKGEPEPAPAKGPWKKPSIPWGQFLAMHAESMLACDFFHKTVWTWRGPIDAVVLVVLHLGSRRVFYSPATYNPDRAWLQQQVRNVSMWTDDEGIQPRFMIRDNDQIFNFAGYDAMLKQMGMEAVHTPLYSPRANAFVESHIGSIKRECLDYFVCFSLDQLNRIVSKWRRHFLDHRPHQGKGIGNKPLDKSFVPKESGPVRCASSLAGLLKSYYRDSA